MLKKKFNLRNCWKFNPLSVSIFKTQSDEEGKGTGDKGKDIYTDKRRQRPAELLPTGFVHRSQSQVSAALSR